VEKSWPNLWDQDIFPYRALSRELSMVLVGHSNYPRVTSGGLPASLSKKWITDVLKSRIGYKGLVVSDDLEMGGVLKARPIEQAAVDHVRAGGDLCLICHLEEGILRSYEALIRQAERNSGFAQRVAESAARVAAFKKKSAEVKRRPAAPSPQKIDRLSRQLWEFSEQVRLANISNQDFSQREDS
jgi:beta-N-acetylhexosaminidase